MSVRMSGKKTSPAVSKGLTGAKGGNRENSVDLVPGEKCHWVQCDHCDRWELFENTGIGGKFDDARISKVKFQCRLCCVSECNEGLEARIVSLERHIAQMRKLLDESMDERMKAVEERLTKLEGRLDACFDNVSTCEVMCKRQNCEALVAVKVSEVAAELSTRVEVCDVRCDDRMSVVNRQVSELSDKLTAFEVKVRDLENDGITAGVAAVSGCAQSVPVGHDVENRSASRMTYAEKVKSKGKGRVYVLGDSLVRGVGKKLEAQCGAVFSARSIGGARIEDVTEEVRKLEASDDRHLVIMVGTNNLQKDGSEIMLRKFGSLIERCKAVRNRAVTVIGIPRRFGVTSLQESRRLGVNVRLSKMCREAGVAFAEYEADRSRICHDRVHFNELGQNEVAGMIFRHCRHFLL